MELITDNINFNLVETSKIYPILKGLQEYQLFFVLNNSTQKISCDVPSKVVIEGSEVDAQRPFNYSNYNIQIEMDAYADYKDHSKIKFYKKLIRFNLTQNLSSIDQIDPIHYTSKSINVQMNQYGMDKYSVLSSSIITDADLIDLRNEHWVIVNIDKQNIPSHTSHFDIKFDLIKWN